MVDDGRDVRFINQDCLELALDFAPLAELLALRRVCHSWRCAVAGVLAALNGGTFTDVDTTPDDGCSKGVLRRYRMIAHDALVRVLMVCLRRGEDGPLLSRIRIPPRVASSSASGGGTAIPDAKRIARWPRAADLASIDVGGAITSAEYQALCLAAAPSIQFVRGPVTISHASTERELLAMPPGRLTSLHVKLAPRGVGLFERCMSALMTPSLTELTIEAGSPVTIGSVIAEGDGGSLLSDLAPNLTRLRLDKVELTAVHWGSAVTGIKHIAVHGPFANPSSAGHLRRFLEAHRTRLVTCDLHRAVFARPPTKQPPAIAPGGEQALLAGTLASVTPELRELKCTVDALPPGALGTESLPPQLERLVLAGALLAAPIPLASLLPQSLTSVDLSDVTGISFTSLDLFCSGGRWLKHLGVALHTSTTPVRNLDPLRLVAHSLVSLRIVAEAGFTFPLSNSGGAAAVLADLPFLEALEVRGGGWFDDAAAFLRVRPAAHLRTLAIAGASAALPKIVEGILDGHCPALEVLRGGSHGGTGAAAAPLSPDDQRRLLRLAPRLWCVSGVDLSAVTAFLPVGGGVHVLRSFRRI